MCSSTGTNSEIRFLDGVILGIIGGGISFLGMAVAYVIASVLPISHYCQ